MMNNLADIEAEQERARSSKEMLDHLMNGKYQEWNKAMEEFREENNNTILDIRFQDLRRKDLSGSFKAC